MFGGGSVKIPPDRLQSGAQCDGYVNNEIYEFVLEEGGEKGKLHELNSRSYQMLMIRILVGCCPKWKKTTTTVL